MKYAAIIVVLAASLFVAAVGGASATPQPTCAIDENGNCMDSSPCYAYQDGSQPDCPTSWYDDYGYTSAWHSDYYAYNGSNCHDVELSRHGSWSWWEVSAGFTACLGGGVVRIQNFHQISTDHLPWYLRYAYSLDSHPSQKYLQGNGTDEAWGFVQWDTRFCSVRCAASVHPWVEIVVNKYGGMMCYTDKSLAYDCRA